MLFGLKQGTAKTELLKPALDENSTLSNRNTTTSPTLAGPNLASVKAILDKRMSRDT